MKLVVGLGNPGEKYKDNRHNVGHMAVDVLLKRDLPKSSLVLKSGVFMNNSGEFVEKIIEQNKIKESDLWIIHDDLDISLGNVKIQKGKGPKAHKGLESIDRTIGSTDYWHVRIGVDNRNPEEKVSGEEYVLGDFNPEEHKVIKKVLDSVANKLAVRLRE